MFHKFDLNKKLLLVLHPQKYVCNSIFRLNMSKYTSITYVFQYYFTQSYFKNKIPKTYLSLQSQHPNLLYCVLIVTQFLLQVWTKLSSFVRGTTYDVIGLEPNKKYNFRVRAENQYGASDPIEMDSPMTAKFPFTVPDPPGQPQIVDSDHSNASLMWERPRSDGGSRIQGYKVEFR